MKKIFLVLILTSVIIGCSSGGGSGSASSSVISSGAETNKKVFVTSTSYSGNFSAGASTANSICTDRAAAAGLTGTWKAYISYDGTTTPYNSFTGNGPWYLTNGTSLVATNLADLIDGSIANQINMDEFGTSITLAPFTAYIGWSLAQTCGSWTFAFAGIFAHVGSINATNTTWTNSGSQDCLISTARIYCFEQ